MTPPGPSRPSTEPANPPRANTAALERAALRWSGFPISAQPRPLVLTSPPIGVGTFTSDEARIAVQEGFLCVDESVPAAAVKAIRKAGLVRGDRPDARVLVTSASPSSMGFGTDRGGRQIPAWLLAITGIDGTCYVMDADSQSLAYPRAEPTVSHSIGGYAKLLGDGLSVRVDFDPPWLTRAGGPASTAVEVVESDAAVAFAPSPDEDRLDADRPGVDAAGDGERPKAVTFRLLAPLGARVLCDVDGSPVVVARRKRNGR